MTRIFTFLSFFFILLISQSGKAQDESDLFIFSLDRPAKGEYHLHTPRYFGQFNKGGYTNQPSFTHEGDVLLSVRKAGESQNDIYSLSLKSMKFRQLTQTSASEYSPRIHPYEEHLTFLRQDGASPMDQQVCKVHLRTGAFDCVTGILRDVGYYTWLSDHTLGLFRIEGDVHKLSYYDVNEEKSRRITSSVGRTLVSDKDGWLIYVHKFTEDYWYIKKYNPANSEITIVTQTVSKSEDFALAADGTYFMAKDHLLYSFHPDLGKEWKQVADLSVYGIRFITRLAVSNDGKRLAVIAEKKKA